MKQTIPVNALRLAIIFIAAGLASASMSNMILSEEKTVMSNHGTLRYGSLSFEEKMRLFRSYQSVTDRKVRDDHNMLSCDKRSPIHNF